MSIRTGPEAVEKAVRALMKRAPNKSTGFYVTWAGISFGDLNPDRSTNPSNYIWFNEPDEPPTQLYNEHMEAHRVNEEKVFVAMNVRQAQVLNQVARRISGLPKGPRGVFDMLQNALQDVGADVEDAGLSFGDDDDYIEYYMFLSSDNHDPA